MERSRPRILLITGEPGVGKTSLVKEVIARYRASGGSVGGILAREVRERGIRVGFELEDLATGNKGTLASVKLALGPKVGKYRVNLKDLEEIGARALMGAIGACDLVVCDEIGPMEMMSPEFKKALGRAIEYSELFLAVVHKRMRDPLTKELRSRSDAELLELTPHNREEVFKRVLRFLGVE